MRKIRIGTDVRLKLSIKPNTVAGFDKIDEFDQTNVKQLRCYLINTSFCKACDKCNNCKPKFQRIGFPDFYHPTHNNINNSGFPSYHMAPANICNYDKFSPNFHDFHIWPGYRGFGIHPEHFHEYCGHMHWHGTRPSNFYPPCHNHQEPFFHGYDHYGIKHCKPEPFDQWLHPEYVPADIFGKENVVLNHPHQYQPFYLADSQVLNEKNTLTCMFPAMHQKMCGIYKLVVVLTVFEQGWGRHNLRTYTIDKGDIFELVDDESGESGNIILDVDDTGNRQNVIDGIYTEHDNYTMADDSNLPVGDFDLNDKQYSIYATLKDGSTVLYNPYDWRYNKLVFESSNPDIVSVDDKGQLHSYPVYESTTVTITVKNADDDKCVYKYKVTVVPADSIKIGFSAIDDIYQMYSTDVCLKEYSTRKNYYTVPNTTSGRYMWVFSQKKVHYIKTTETDMDRIAELSSGFRVPMISYGKKDNYFCYRSAAPILEDNMNIKIKFS